MDNKKVSLMLILVSLTCSLFLLGFQIKSFLQAKEDLQQANADLWQAQELSSEALEDWAQYYANYSRYALLDIAKYQQLYNQYSRDFGNDSAYALDMLDKLNYAKLCENDNLWHIDGVINGLVSDGTITRDEGVWLKNRIRELRIP
jgi:biopolymer transport protein ExbB/TolQ